MMQRTETTTTLNVVQFLNDVAQLTKLRLSFSVVFSSITGYLIAFNTFDVDVLILLVIGGFAVVGSSNAFNQWIEKDRDALMKRTQNRPLPSGRMQDGSALFIAVLLGIVGLFLLYTINAKTAFFAAFSILVYTCVYTPLKRITSLTVFVGAFPGAIPFMLGWVAATNQFGIEPGTLFLIQFFWQFPHFWAIGWYLEDDYKSAGYIMLPSGKANQATAFQIVFYSLWTVVASLLPFFGITGTLSLSAVGAILVFLLGLLLIHRAIVLMKEKSKMAAKQLILTSILHLTGVQIIYVIDKFL